MEAERILLRQHFTKNYLMIQSQETRMRGISKEKLRKFQQSMFAREAGREAELRLLTLLINECQELNPWLTSDVQPIHKPEPPR